MNDADPPRGSIKDLRAQNQEMTDRVCPECGEHPLVIKWSRNGKFLACQGFPSCKYTEPLEKAKATPSGEACDKCGSPMVVLSINGNRFLGCSKYPECKNTKSLSTGVHCPQPGCTGQMVERKTHRGKVFYGCSAYPTCTFATWDKPVDKKCPQCSYPMLVFRDTKRKGAILRCPSCRFEESLQSESQTADAVPIAGQADF